MLNSYKDTLRPIQMSQMNKVLFIKTNILLCATDVYASVIDTHNQFNYVCERKASNLSFAALKINSYLWILDLTYICVFVFILNVTSDTVEHCMIFHIKNAKHRCLSNLDQL